MISGPAFSSRFHFGHCPISYQLTITDCPIGISDSTSPEPDRSSSSSPPQILETLSHLRQQTPTPSHLNPMPGSHPWSSSFPSLHGPNSGPQISFLFFFSSVLLGPHLQRMEVPRLGVQSALLLPAYTTATAMQDPSRICDLHHSSWQHQILEPLSEARDRTRNLMVPSQFVSTAPRWELQVPKFLA